jgi:hypothetical protein
MNITNTLEFSYQEIMFDSFKDLLIKTRENLGVYLFHYSKTLRMTIKSWRINALKRTGTILNARARKIQTLKLLKRNFENAMK